MKNRRLQFGLRTALLLLTIVAVLLAVGSQLPSDIFQIICAVFVIVAGTTTLFFVLYAADRTYVRCNAPRSLAIGSMLLTAVSIWVIAIIFLPLPGSRGSPQFWDARATAVFALTLRIATFFGMLIIPVVCGLIGKIRLEFGNRFRLGWLVAAITAYFAAVAVMIDQVFVPLD
jgi:hypothetical protein